MLDTYTNTAQTVAADGIILLNNNRIKTGCSVTHAAGSGAISLNEKGVYLVHFNADAAESTTAGNITVQLFINGMLYPGAEATADSTATTDIVNLDFETAICVKNCKCCDTDTLTFVNIGVAAVFSNVEVVVTKKIC